MESSFSSFGMRKILFQVTTKCTENDFAAPSGTPIMASGSGTVTRADGVEVEEPCKNKHNSTYETIYAHMKSLQRN